MADELLDLVDEDDNIVGTVYKNTAHTDPTLFHREVAIALFDTNGYTLLQQRSMDKANEPGVWKIAAAGHVNAGEDPQQAAKREVQEELGIDIAPIYLKKEFRQYKNKESRFTYVYYAFLNEQADAQLQTSEVMATEWVKVEDLEDFAATHDFDIFSFSADIIREVTALSGQLGVTK